MEGFNITNTVNGVYMPLSRLQQIVWKNNPKTHRQDLIQFSIMSYGFRDPVEIAEGEDLVVVGHGRIEALTAMKERGDDRPRGINVTEDGSDWLVPTIVHRFADRNESLRYALMNNRANTNRLSQDDYRASLFNAALEEVGNEELPGFGAQDLNESGVTGTMPFELPEWKPFDATQLPDVPKYESTVPESFTVIFTFQTYMQMKEALALFTFGARKSLPPTAKYASIEASGNLEKYRAVFAAAPQAEEVEVEETGAQEELEQPQSAFALEPKWIGGLCANCGGSGCEVCKGAGDEATWHLAENSRKNEPDSPTVKFGEPVDPIAQGKHRWEQVTFDIPEAIKPVKKTLVVDLPAASVPVPPQAVPFDPKDFVLPADTKFNKQEPKDAAT